MWGEIIKNIEMLQKKVERRGGGYDVVHCHGEDKGESLGHHDTKEEAMEQHRAIEASKHAKKSIDNYLEKNGARPASEVSATVPLPASSSRPMDESKPSSGRAAGVSYESSAPPEPAKIASMKKQIEEYLEKYNPNQPIGGSNLPTFGIEKPKPKRVFPTAGGNWIEEDSAQVSRQKPQKAKPSQ